MAAETLPCFKDTVGFFAAGESDDELDDLKVASVKPKLKSG